MVFFPSLEWELWRNTDRGGNFKAYHSRDRGKSGNQQNIDNGVKICIGDLGLFMELRDIIPSYKSAIVITDIKNPDHVRLIQSALRTKVDSRLVVDGVAGDKTAIAWAKFKKQTFQSDPALVGVGSLTVLENSNPKRASDPHPYYLGGLAQQIVNVCDKRDYELARKDGEINIVGIEGFNPDGTTNNDAPDQWNDVISILGFSGGTPYLAIACRGTTEPGKYYTDNPLNANGAARLQLGQHKGLWIVGIHRGYEAMQQVGSAKLVRDKNRNHSRDDKETIESGNGINLHTTKTTGWRGSASQAIGQWSAGCSVIQSPAQFLDFMKIIKGSAQYKSNKAFRFDYTLLWKGWFN